MQKMTHTFESDPSQTVEIILNDEGHPLPAAFDAGARAMLDQTNLFVARGEEHATIQEFLVARIAEILQSANMTRVTRMAKAMETYLPEHIVNLSRGVEKRAEPGAGQRLRRDQRAILRLAEGAYVTRTALETKTAEIQS